MHQLDMTKYYSRISSRIVLNAGVMIIKKIQRFYQGTWQASGKNADSLKFQPSAEDR